MLGCVRERERERERERVVVGDFCVERESESCCGRFLCVVWANVCLCVRERERERERERDLLALLYAFINWLVAHLIRKQMARSLAAAIEMKVSATTLWDTIKNPDIVPKLMPDYVAGCEYVEGDGGAGSIRFMKFGPAVAHFVTFAKERIDVVDEDAKKLSYSVIDGELLNHFKAYQVCVEVVQGAVENECILNWILEYEPINPEMPPPEISKEGAIGTFKALESYLLTLNNTK